MAKILVVEDDEEFAELVEDSLKSESHLVDRADSGKSALEMVSVYPYDLIVLDWNLPELSGLSVCKQLRSQGLSMPILMLTSNATIDHKETGLDTGADDYLTKPVNPRELNARVRALLRRPTEISGDVLKAREITLDCRAHCITRDGKSVDLLAREFALLEFLMRNKGKVFSQDELLDRVWKSDAAVTLDTVRTCIRRVRSKIDRDGEESIIRTVYSVGYTIDPD